MPEARWLDSQERTAWLRIAAVLELLPGALDSQLLQDEDLTHFEYFTLASLSEAPKQVLRVTQLASLTNATLPRLSRVLNRLEKLGLLERQSCAEDRRAKNVVLTEAGWNKVVHAAPNHVENVRRLVLDRLSPEQVKQLSAIMAQLLEELDPEGRMFASLSPN